MSDQLQVLRPQGRLDNAASPAFEAQALGMIEAGARAMLIDLAGVEYISSAGLRVALTVAKRMKAAGGRLGFCAPTPAVKEVFEISGVESIVEVHGDEQTARSRLAG